MKVTSECDFEKLIKFHLNFFFTFDNPKFIFVPTLSSKYNWRFFNQIQNVDIWCPNIFCSRFINLKPFGTNFAKRTIYSSIKKNTNNNQEFLLNFWNSNINLRIIPFQDEVKSHCHSFIIFIDC